VSVALSYDLWDVRHREQQFIQGQGLDLIIAELRLFRDRVTTESKALPTKDVSPGNCERFAVM